MIDAIQCLDERERYIMEQRFGLMGTMEMTQKEVADLLGISQSYISRLEKKSFPSFVIGSTSPFLNWTYR